MTSYSIKTLAQYGKMSVLNSRIQRKIILNVLLFQGHPMDLFLLISVLHANFYWMGVLGKMMCSLEGKCSWESYGEGAGGICYLEYLLCGIY